MIAYSVAATVFRATNFDRVEFRKLGLTSGDAKNEFGDSVDMTESLPTFPYIINTPNVTTIRFVVIQVTGGSALIRFSKSNAPYNVLDLTVDGTLVMAGVDINQIVILGTPTGGCAVQVFGMGTP